MTTDRKFPEELRDPENIFYLESEGCHIWFVNNSDETLTKVSSSSGGFADADDESITMEGKNPKVYKDVKPKEAVLVDKYDMFFDGDFMIEFAVDVTAPSFGQKQFKSELKKGGSPNATLLWKDLPKEVSPPEKSAQDYIEQSGNYLDKSINLNRGDLTQDYASKRLASSGLQLQKAKHRNGTVTEYKFSDVNGNVIFQTCEFERACVFVETLKK